MGDPRNAPALKTPGDGIGRAMRCPACTQEMDDGGAACPSCGVALDDSYAKTQILPDDSKPPPDERRDAHSHTPLLF